MIVFIVVEECGGVAEIPYVTVDSEIAEQVWRECVIANCPQFDFIEACEMFGDDVVREKDSDDFVYDEKTKSYYRFEGDAEYFVKILECQVEDIPTTFGKDQ